MKVFLKLLALALSVSFVASLGECPPSWEKDKSVYDSIRERWVEPPCYEFTLVREFFGPIELTGPFDVRVENGEVVNSTDYPKGMVIPTMEGLYEFYYNECLDGCPDKGPAWCSISYAGEGHIVSIDIDYEMMISDDEFRFLVSDFSLCDDFITIVADDADAGADPEDDFSEIVELKKKLRKARNKKKKLKKLCKDTE